MFFGGVLVKKAMLTLVFGSAIFLAACGGGDEKDSADQAAKKMAEPNTSVNIAFFTSTPPKNICNLTTLLYQIYARLKPSPSTS